jgi:uncharacterized protein (DUF1778 family)
MKNWNSIFRALPDEELEDLKKMCENPEKIYLPKEDYDVMMKAINEPPKYIEGLANLMERKLP